MEFPEGNANHLLDTDIVNDGNNTEGIDVGNSNTLCCKRQWIFNLQKRYFS